MTFMCLIPTITNNTRIIINGIPVALNIVNRVATEQINKLVIVYTFGLDMISYALILKILLGTEHKPPYLASVMTFYTCNKHIFAPQCTLLYINEYFRLFI